MKTKDSTYIAMFAAIISVCAWITVPSVVPFTLQTLGVFLAVGLLGGKRGTVSVLVYILLGAVGAPVFSGFTGGIGSLAGVTGGYIVGFLACALVMWLCERLFGCGRTSVAAGMVLGLLVCYVFGTAWFMVIYLRTKGVILLGAVLAKCVLPFIVPDLIKIGIALFLVKRLKPHLNPAKAQ